MNTSEALEWLLEHEDDPADDEDIELPSIEAVLNEAGPSSSGALEGARKSSIKTTIYKLFGKSNFSLQCTTSLNCCIISYSIYMLLSISLVLFSRQ